MAYRVRRMTAAEAATATAWSYADAYAVYDAEEPIDPAKGYFAVEDEDAVFVGFCCFGAEARVAGVEEEPDVLDVGVGMDPALTGEGRGRAFGAAVLAYGRARYAPERFRALVMDWNERSLATCAAIGFERAGEHVDGERRFIVLERFA